MRKHFKLWIIIIPLLVSFAFLGAWRVSSQDLFGFLYEISGGGSGAATKLAVPAGSSVSGGTLTLAGMGGGDVSVSGTPSNHQWPGWTGASSIKGFTITASKPVCSDASGDPAVCAGTEGVWLAAGGKAASATTADTATALAADPANCDAGQVALGINASGVAECTATPSIQALTITGANSLGLGTAGSAVGSFNLKNETSGYLTFLPVTGALSTPRIRLGKTFTNAKYCTYASDNATGLTCNAEGGSGYTNLTSFVDQTAWRLFYSNGSGDITELALGSDGTYLRSNGASSAPTFDTPAGAGTMTSVKEGHVLVGAADMTTIDFGLGFDVTDNGTSAEVALDLSEYTGTIAGGAGGFTVDADGDVVVKSITPTQTANPDVVELREGSGAGTNKTTITTQADLVADATITFGEQSLDFAAGTFTNGYLCNFTSSGTVIGCNVNPASLGGATAINAIGDAAADGTIDQTGYKQIWTSTLNSAGAVWTFTNTTADLTADVSFIDFKYTDNGDSNGYYMRGYDNNGTDLQWSIGANGAATFASITSNAADGEHYGLFYNTSANPAASGVKGAIATVGATPVPQFSDGSNWKDILYSGSALGTPASGTMTNVTGLPKISSTAYSSATSAEFATAISDETGTGNVVLSNSPTFDDDITLGGATGVKVTGGSGIATIAGIGNTNNENLTLNFEGTANKVTIGTGTGVTEVNTALNFASTGWIQGGIKVDSDADGEDNTTMTAAGMYGTLFIATGAGTWTLPTAVLGMSMCLMDSGTAHDLILDCQGTDTIRLKGTEGSAGVGITNASGTSTGDFICVVAVAANKWSTMGMQGTWASQ